MKISKVLIVSMIIACVSSFAAETEYEEGIGAILNGHFVPLNQEFSDLHESFFAGTYSEKDKPNVMEWFLSEVRNNNIVAVIAMVKKNPTILDSAFTGDLCANTRYRGPKPVFRRIQDDIRAADGKKKEDLRTLTYLMAENVANEYKDLVFFSLGLNGMWKEHILRALEINNFLIDSLFNEQEDSKTHPEEYQAILDEIRDTGLLEHYRRPNRIGYDLADW